MSAANPRAVIGDNHPPEPTPAEALAFLRQVRQASQGGGLLIGVDLVKPLTVLEPAYDDALGVHCLLLCLKFEQALVIEKDFPSHAGFTFADAVSLGAEFVTRLDVAEFRRLPGFPNLENGESRPTGC